MSSARIFFFLAPLLYAAFALLTPPFQTPDEQQHLFRAYQLAHGQLIAERRGAVTGGEVAPGLLTATQRELGTLDHLAPRSAVRIDWRVRFARATPVESGKSPKFANFWGAAPYTPMGYLPQIAAIRVAEPLGLSVEATVRLGRLFNAGLTFCLLAAAMALLRGGRIVLLCVGLLPMTAACAGSFGQDGLVIGASALLVTLALRGAGAGRKAAHGLAAVVLTLVVTLSKYVYLPLGLLSLFRQRGNGGVSLSKASLAGVGLAAIVTALWLRGIAGLATPMLPGYPLPAEQLRQILHDPMPFAIALAGSYSPPKLFELWAMLFTFGWLDVGPVWLAALSALVAFGLVWWHGGEDAQPLPPHWRAWWLLLCLGIAFGLALAVYLAGNPLGSRTLVGLQGRYYVPLMLPVMLAVRRSGAKAMPRLPLIVAGLMLFANTLSLLAILRAFYV